MQKQKQILIICGEASGELHAANLTKALLKMKPDLKISGMGGDLMRSVGVEIYSDIKDLAVLGLFDVLKKLPKFFRLQKLILKKIQENKPDCLIFVDFSGFNLRLAKAINKKIPTIYYISPQVWASRAGRIKTIKEYISKMIVIFRFEKEFYQRYGIDTDFVGHPLLDIVQPAMDKEEFLHKFGLSGSKTTIALLPGSRRQEIDNILPIMLKTCIFIENKFKEVQFVIVKSPNVNWSSYNHKISRLNLDLKIIEGKTYDCLNIADFCLVASGTATLEVAIMQKPFVVIYKMNLLNYFLYRPQVRVPYIGMVNIVAGRKIIPEFIQFKANPKEIASCIFRILENPNTLERMRNELSQFKSLLGERGASIRAAQIIFDFLKQKGEDPK